MKKRTENIAFWLAARAPKVVRRYMVVDAIAKATTGEYSNTNVTSLPAMEVLNRI